MPNIFLGILPSSCVLSGWWGERHTLGDGQRLGGKVTTRKERNSEDRHLRAGVEEIKSE